MTEQEQKGRRKEWDKRYREKHKDRIQERSRRWYLEHKELADRRVKECQRKYPDRVKARGKRWQDANKDAIRAKYLRNKTQRIRGVIARSLVRRKVDVNYRLRGNLRHRVWMALRGYVKSDNSLELIGCSAEHLKKHLEAQFSNGMSWQNYGFMGWHIDHIIPCCQFDLSLPEQQIACFHYSNLQPLWASDNFRKPRKLCV